MHLSGALYVARTSKASPKANRSLSSTGPSSDNIGEDNRKALVPQSSSSWPDSSTTAVSSLQQLSESRRSSANVCASEPPVAVSSTYSVVGSLLTATRTH